MLKEQQSRIKALISKIKIEKAIVDIDLLQHELMLMNVNLQLEDNEYE